MEMLRLIRLHTGSNGTFGALIRGAKQIAVTCELPWLDNAKRVSCIPQGTYTVTPYSSMRFMDAWRVEDVPGRSDILIHTGNTIKDILGCILVGAAYGEVEGLPAVLNSKLTMAKLKRDLPPSFTLSVEGCV